MNTTALKERREKTDWRIPFSRVQQPFLIFCGTALQVLLFETRFEFKDRTDSSLLGKKKTYVCEIMHT